MKNGVWYCIEDDFLFVAESYLDITWIIYCKQYPFGLSGFVFNNAHMDGFVYLGEL